MTIIALDPAEELRSLVARMERLLGPLTPEQQAALDSYGNPGKVAPGELIESAWGNAVSDHVMRSFPTTVERDTWTDAPPGAVCTTQNPHAQWQRAWDNTWVRMGGRRALIATATGTSLNAGEVKSLNWDYRSTEDFGPAGTNIYLPDPGVWMASALIKGPAVAATITVYDGTGANIALATFNPAQAGVSVNFLIQPNTPGYWFYYHIWNAAADAQWYNGVLNVARLTP